MKKNFVSLAEARPDLAKEWNYEKNGDLKPENVSCGSGKKVWWIQYDKSPITNKTMRLEWEAIICDRTRGNGNPIKVGKQVLKNYNDLLSLNPDLASEWNYERNGNLKPDMITCNSNRKVWWIQYDKTLNIKFEWIESVANRTKGKDNPFKSNKQVLVGYNDLQSLRPDLAEEWNYERNGNLKPDMVVCGSHKKVWWMQYDKSPITGKMMKLEWEAVIDDRVRGSGNPIKIGQQVLIGYNDLQSLRPDLAAEWNYERNGNLKPDMVTCYSNKKVWWIQYDKNPVTGEPFKLEWKSSVNNRKNGKGNPFKSNKQVLVGYNDLQSLRPDLAAEWNYERNGNLKPDMVTCGTRKRVWWMQYDKSPITGKMMKLEWEAVIDDRVRGSGNPIKVGQQVLIGYNDLQSLRPDLAAEWNYERNGDLKPDMITCGSSKKVWWIQYDMSPITGDMVKLEWEAIISDRVKGHGCPMKDGHKVLKGYNDLASLHPNLADEWNYERNGKLTPDMVTCGAGKKVWWIQKIKDEKTKNTIQYEWMATIASRVAGSDCPYLTTYKGEEYIKQYLQRHNVSFDIQQKFSDLLGTGDGQLSYDFSIPDEKYGYILIEYNGIQHYEAVDYFGGEEQFKKQKEHDKRKRDYAKKHGYKLITVKYTYDTYESIEEYLDKELKQLGVIDDTRKEESVNDAA